MHVEFWWESQKGRDHYGDLDVGGRIILKCVSQKLVGMIWNGFI
jgi:hypothetical protein